MYPVRGGSALWALQQAVFTELSISADMRNLCQGRVYDAEVPEDEQIILPYVVIGEATETPKDRLTTTGNDHTLLIHVYSSYEGTKQVKQIMEAIHALFHQKTFTVSGFRINSSRLEFSQVITEGDQIKHGLMRFRIWLQPQI